MFFLLPSLILLVLASLMCGQKQPKSAENNKKGIKGDKKKKSSKGSKELKMKQSKESSTTEELNKRPPQKPVEPNSFDQLQPREMWCERKKQCSNDEIPHADKDNISNYATFKCLDKDDCVGLD